MSKGLDTENATLVTVNFPGAMLQVKTFTSTRLSFSLSLDNNLKGRLMTYSLWKYFILKSDQPHPNPWLQTHRQTVQLWEYKYPNTQTDWCYKVHYLPASLSYKVDNNCIALFDILLWRNIKFSIQAINVMFMGWSGFKFPCTILLI